MTYNVFSGTLNHTQSINAFRVHSMRCCQGCRQRRMSNVDWAQTPQRLTWFNNWAPCHLPPPLTGLAFQAAHLLRHLRTVIGL